MAKVGLWLRGARGKYAGGVLQKAENGTVVREHVIPANPKTISQMKQRVAFGTAATAAKALLPIIGQTFQGAASEKLNRREFMKANITRMKAWMDANVGSEYAEWLFSFNPKSGNMTVVPNPWVISNGTLSAPLVNFSISNNGQTSAVYLPFTFGNKTLAVGSKISGEDLIQAFFGVTAGSQITFVGIVSSNTQFAMAVENDPTTELPAAGADTLKFSTLVARRLVTKESDGSTVTVTAETTSAELETLLFGCIDTEKTSDSLLIELTGGLSYHENTATLSNMGQVDVFDFDASTETLMACGVFQSRLVNKVWMYSPCVMTSIISVGDRAADGPDTTRHGFNADDAILSYLGVSNIVSTLYTRQGNEAGNSIGTF